MEWRFIPREGCCGAVCAEEMVQVTPGMTLDLNGHNLTAAYVVGFDTANIVDKIGTGKLIAPEKNVVLDEENAMIPVYDGEGYLFAKAGFAIRRDTQYSGSGVRINAIACPTRMDVVELLKNGSADNNLQIVLLLTWNTGEGTGSQRFVFNDDVVASIYSSNRGTWSSYGKMFSMVLTGFESLENVTAKLMLVSGTNAEYISTGSVALN